MQLFLLLFQLEVYCMRNRNHFFLRKLKITEFHFSFTHTQQTYVSCNFFQKTENKTTENNTKADDSEEIKSKEERIRTLIQIQVDYRQVHKQIVESIV